MLLPVNRCQSPISTASANPVNVRDPTQAASRRTTGVNSLSAASSAIALSSRPRRAVTRQHGVVVGLERHLWSPGCRSAAGAASGHAPRSTLPAGVDDPLPQQQLRQPVPGPHQITAAVLARPHQIPRGLLLHRRHRHRGDLTQPQQPRQVHRIPGVGLDPIPGRALQLRRRRDHAPHPGRGQRPVQPEPGRPGLIGHRDRAGQLPIQDRM